MNTTIISADGTIYTAERSRKKVGKGTSYVWVWNLYVVAPFTMPVAVGTYSNKAAATAAIADHAK